MPINQSFCITLWFWDLSQETQYRPCCIKSIWPWCKPFTKSRELSLESHARLNGLLQHHITSVLFCFRKMHCFSKTCAWNHGDLWWLRTSKSKALTFSAGNYTDFLSSWLCCTRLKPNLKCHGMQSVKYIVRQYISNVMVNKFLRVE